MKTVIVIPTYNEKQNITRLIPQICGLPVSDLNILVVDDNSPDGTADIVESLRNNVALSEVEGSQSNQNKLHNRINLIKRPSKLGLGSAYIAGFQWAMDNRADLIFEMDADGSHDPQDIPRLIEAINTPPAPLLLKEGIKGGYDVVIGSRRIKGGQITGWNLYRHLASWGAMAATRLILGLKTHDVTAGFRCYRSQVLKELDIKSIKTNGYAFQEEMVWRCEKKGFQIKEIPITFKDRELGDSKLNYKDITEFFITLIRLKFSQWK